MRLPDSVVAVAKKLGVAPWLLGAVIQFESGFNPRAISRDGKSYGLLQFRGKTIADLGYSSGMDLINKNNTVDSQVYGPVYQYFKNQGPFPTVQSFLMSVFYPAYKYVPEVLPFPKLVRDANIGINTPIDYINRVYKIGGEIYVPRIAVVMSLIIISLGVYYHGFTTTKNGSRVR